MMTPKRLSEEADLAGVMHAAQEDVPDPERMAKMLSNLEQAALGTAAALTAAKAAKSSALTWSWWTSTKGVAVLVGALSLSGGVALHFRQNANPALTPAEPRAIPTQQVPVPEPLVDLPVLAPSVSASAEPIRAITPGGATATTGTATNGKSEAQLLEEARAALRSDPATALARCNEHAKRHPQGALVEERERIAIEAQQKLGRTAEARARANRFFTSFPNSTYRARLERLLEVP
jgi:hypothetical protein